MKGLKARRALRKRNVEKESRVERNDEYNSTERMRRGREPAPLIKEKKIKVRKVKERDPNFHASDLFMLPSHANKREQLEFKNVGTPELDLDKVGDDLDMEMAYLEKKLGLNKKKTGKKAAKAMKDELGLDDGDGDFFSFVDGIVADVEKKTGKKRKVINADELCSDASDEESGDEEEVDLDGYDDEDDEQRRSAKTDIDRFISGGGDEDDASDQDMDADEDEGSGSESEEGSGDVDGSDSDAISEEEIPIPPPGSYVPPHMRAKLAEQEAKRLAREAAAAASGKGASKKTLSAADIKLPSQLMKDLRVSLTGLINRVSEGNLGPVATKLLPLFTIPEAVYVANGTSATAAQKSRGLAKALLTAWETAVAEIVVSAVERSALSNVQSTKSLVSTQMTLVACVHVVACGRIGPALVQRIAQQVLNYLPSVDRLAELETLDAGKRDEEELHRCDDLKAMCKWTVTALAVLFDLGLLDSKLLFESIKLLASVDGGDSLEDAKTPLPPARVDLLLLLLKIAGPRLRRESPADFKDVLVYLTSRADALTYMTTSAKASERAAFESKSPQNKLLLSTMTVMGSRVEFLMLELQKLKNNQASASPFPALHKWLASFPPLKLLVVSTGGEAKGVANLDKFAVSFAKNATNQRGLTGNILSHIASLPSGDISWSESSDAANMVGDHRDTMRENQQTSTEKLLELAKAQRINIDVQKSIFVAVMGAADVDDAIERVSAALHAHASERGGVMSLKKFAPHLWAILMHCAARETKYNPFYSILTRELLSGAGYMSTASMHQHRANINNLLVDPDAINQEGSSTVHLRRAFRQAFASQMPTLTENQPRRIRALARMFGVAVATVEGVSLSTIRFMDWSGSATIASVFTTEVLRTAFNVLAGEDEGHAPRGAALGVSHFVHMKSSDELDVVLLELFRPVLTMDDVKEALILIIQEELQGKLASKRAEQMADLARRLLVAGELPRV